jgi:hypothetical protein
MLEVCARTVPTEITSRSAISLLAIGLGCRSETETVFSRDTISDRRQFGLYALAILLTILPTELNITERILGLVPLTGQQWFLCFAFAFGLLCVDEVIKWFLRRRHAADAPGAANAELSPA